MSCLTWQISVDFRFFVLSKTAEYLFSHASSTQLLSNRKYLPFTAIYLTDQKTYVEHWYWLFFWAVTSLLLGKNGVMVYLHCRIPIPIPTRTTIQMVTLYQVGTFHTAWTWIQIPIPTVN